MTWQIESKNIDECKYSIIAFISAIVKLSAKLYAINENNCVYICNYSRIFLHVYLQLCKETARICAIF